MSDKMIEMVKPLSNQNPNPSLYKNIVKGCPEQLQDYAVKLVYYNLNHNYSGEKDINPTYNDMKKCQKLLSEQIKMGIFYSCIFNNHFVGYCNLKGTDDQFDIFNLIIDPDYRGRGFATQFIYKAEQLAKEEKRKELWLKVYYDNPARKLYEKLGFKYSKDVE